MKVAKSKSKTNTVRKPAQRVWETLLVTFVRGLPYHDYSPEHTKRGMRVKLFHEPSNQFDSQAIKVCLAGPRGGLRHIGYVPKNETHLLHNAKAEGCKFYAFVNQHFPNNLSHRMVAVTIKVLRPKAQKRTDNHAF